MDEAGINRGRGRATGGGGRRRHRGMQDMQGSSTKVQGRVRGEGEEYKQEQRYLKEKGETRK